MQMYSIEHGEIYSESYNINHVLHSSSTGHRNSSKQNKDPLNPNWDYSHFHIIPLNSQALNNGDGVSHYINILPIEFSFLFQNNLHVSPIVPSLDFFAKLKILPAGYSSLHKSTVLLI